MEKTFVKDTLRTNLFYQCAEARFEIFGGNELLVGFKRPIPKDAQKSFFASLSAFGKPIGYIEFSMALTVRGAAFYRAIQLHSVSDVDPAASNIYQLLSKLPRKMKSGEL